MLIRICDHFKDNPKRIDKLIAIKGLPEEWIFRETTEGKELKRPWEADIDKNIPHDIRNLCEPMYIVFRHPAIQQGAKEVIEKKQILGIRLDYNSEPGRQLWDDIERYMEESIPRNERIPVPVVCAKDERSAFETYTPRRNTRGSLELTPSQVPLVDLTKYVQFRMEETLQATVAMDIPESVKETPAKVEEVQVFQCDACERDFRSAQALKIHQARPKNHKKEKAGVS